MNEIFDTMRERWKEYLIRDGQQTREGHPAALDQEVERLRTGLCRDAARSCLWEDLPDPGDVYTRDRICLKTCSRLEILALGCSAEGSVRKGDRGLKQEILDGLDFVNRNWYHENQRKGGEWWHREIGIPLSLNRIAALLYDEIGKERLSRLMKAVGSWVPDPGVMCIEDIPETSTGANRAWKCLVLAGCGILTGDMARLDKASASICDVFCFTRSGDGFYEDGSFVQHLKFAYNGGYGLSFLKTVSEYIYLTARTPWQISAYEDEMMEIWIRRSFAPFLYGGCFMNMVNGRQVARMDYEEDVAGREAAEAILTYAATLPRDRREQLEKSLCQWMDAEEDDRDDRDDRDNRDDSNGRRENCHVNQKEPKISGEQEDGRNTGFHLFAGMDRAVCRRKGFAVGISMCSGRIGRYESIHDENLRGWHLSDGAVYLYNGDRLQFCGGFFPTVNAGLISGTTVDTLVREERGVGFGLELMPPNDWAGGCVLEGRYGTAGMELFAEGTSLTARKSWFLWEEEIVCLGAGISCDGGYGALTVVENRKLTGLLTVVENRKLTGLPAVGESRKLTGLPAGGAESRKLTGLPSAAESLKQLDAASVPPPDLVSSDGKTVFLTLGRGRRMEGVETLHLKGFLPGTDIGYYFPRRADIDLFMETRTDCWNSINSLQTSQEPVTNTYVEMIWNHGRDPVDEKYEYVILPGKGREELEEYAGKTPVEILANTAQVQAVCHKGLKITGFHFWENEGGQAAGLGCSTRAAVLIREKEDSWVVSVSDPTWNNQEGIRLQLPFEAACAIRKPLRAEVLRFSPKAEIWVNTASAGGKSIEIILGKCNAH